MDAVDSQREIGVLPVDPDAMPERIIQRARGVTTLASPAPKLIRTCLTIRSINVR